MAYYKTSRNLKVQSDTSIFYSNQGDTVGFHPDESIFEAKTDVSFGYTIILVETLKGGEKKEFLGDRKVGVFPSSVWIKSKEAILVDKLRELNEGLSKADAEVVAKFLIMNDNTNDIYQKGNI